MVKLRKPIISYAYKSRGDDTVRFTNIGDAPTNIGLSMPQASD